MNKSTPNVLSYNGLKSNDVYSTLFFFYIVLFVVGGGGGAIVAFFSLIILIMNISQYIEANLKSSCDFSIFFSQNLDS